MRVPSVGRPPLRTGLARWRITGQVHLPNAGRAPTQRWPPACCPGRPAQRSGPTTGPRTRPAPARTTPGPPSGRAHHRPRRRAPPWAPTPALTTGQSNAPSIGAQRTTLITSAPRNAPGPAPSALGRPAQRSGLSPEPYANAMRTLYSRPATRLRPLAQNGIGTRPNAQTQPRRATRKRYPAQVAGQR